MTLAVTLPTIGCRQYADRLGDQAFAIAKSTVQEHLVTHGLGRRSRRAARHRHLDRADLSTAGRQRALGLLTTVVFEPSRTRYKAPDNTTPPMWKLSGN